MITLGNMHWTQYIKLFIGEECIVWHQIRVISYIKFRKKFRSTCISCFHKGIMLGLGHLLYDSESCCIVCSFLQWFDCESLMFHWGSRVLCNISNGKCFISLLNHWRSCCIIFNHVCVVQSFLQCLCIICASYVTLSPYDLTANH